MAVGTTAWGLVEVTGILRGQLFTLWREREEGRGAHSNTVFQRHTSNDLTLGLCLTS